MSDISLLLTMTQREKVQFSFCTWEAWSGTSYDLPKATQHLCGRTWFQSGLPNMLLSATLESSHASMQSTLSSFRSIWLFCPIRFILYFVPTSLNFLYEYLPISFDILSKHVMTAQQLAIPYYLILRLFPTNGFLFCFIFVHSVFCDAGYQAQGLRHAKQVLSHWATVPAWLVFNRQIHTQFIPLCPHRGKLCSPDTTHCMTYLRWGWVRQWLSKLYQQVLL